MRPTGDPGGPDHAQPWTSPNESRALWLQDRQVEGAMFLGCQVCGWKEEDTDQHKARGRGGWAVGPTCSSVHSPLMLAQPLFRSGNYGAMRMQSVLGGNADCCVPNFTRFFPMISRVPTLEHSPPDDGNSQAFARSPLHATMETPGSFLFPGLQLGQPCARRKLAAAQVPSVAP